MIRIIFVCHGNICRSPSAEYIMKDVAARNGRTDIETASAAVSSEEIGNPIIRPPHESWTGTAFPTKEAAPEE